jgi:hypothetical protein
MTPTAKPNPNIIPSAKTIKIDIVSLNAIIDVFEEGGIITIEKKIPPAGGTPIISYSLGWARPCTVIVHSGT